MVKPKYDELKATQVAGYILKNTGGTMNYMKLVKLIYLAERTSLAMHGVPMIYDDLFSLPKGPVPSKTLNIIREKTSGKYFPKYIKNTKFYDVKLICDTETTELSKADVKILNQIINEYGNFDEWKLNKVVHQLPEYTELENGAGSKKRIPIDSIAGSIPRRSAA